MSNSAYAIEISRQVRDALRTHFEAAQRMADLLAASLTLDFVERTLRRKPVRRTARQRNRARIQRRGWR